MTNPHADTLRRYQAARRTAITPDRNLSAEGQVPITRTGLQKARAAIAAATPPMPTVPGSTRGEILDGIRPTTADSLAVAAREREKVQALRDAGRRLDQIIAGASPVRLGAILDSLEIMPEVLASSEGPEIVAEFEALVFDRLSEIGHQPAVDRIDAERRIAPQAAWSRVLTEAQQGSVSVKALQDLYRADVEGYREIEPVLDPSLDETIRRWEIEQERADQVAPQPVSV